MTPLRCTLLALMLCLIAAVAGSAAVQAQAPAADPNADTEEPWLEGFIPDDLPDDDIVGRDLDAAPPSYDDADEVDAYADWDEQDAADSATAGAGAGTTRGAGAMPRTRRRSVPGRVAMLRPDGTAAIPLKAPKRVRGLIRAANRIVGKRYKRRGGHQRLKDSGYDGAGAVGYALVKAKIQRRVLTGPRLKRAHRTRAGRYVTIYVSKGGHVYLEVAGLRLDTSTFGDSATRTGVRWRPVVGKRRGFGVRHPAGL